MLRLQNLWISFLYVVVLYKRCHKYHCFDAGPHRVCNGVCVCSMVLLYKWSHKCNCFDSDSYGIWRVIPEDSSMLYRFYTVDLYKVSHKYHCFESGPHWVCKDSSGFFSLLYTFFFLYNWAHKYQCYTYGVCGYHFYMWWLLYTRSNNYHCFDAGPHWVCKDSWEFFSLLYTLFFYITGPASTNVTLTESVDIIFIYSGCIYSIPQITRFWVGSSLSL